MCTEKCLNFEDASELVTRCLNCNFVIVTVKPSKPNNLHVTDIWKDYMTVVWEAPQSDGGSAVTGYTLEQRDAFDVNYKFIASVDANTTQYQVRATDRQHLAVRVYVNFNIRFI